MDYEAECRATLAQLLELPDGAFAAHLAVATDPALITRAAAGHAALFAERVSDLSLDERQELFAETFRSGAAEDHRRCIVAALREGGNAARSAEFTTSVERLQETLLGSRNPYHHLLTAITSLLSTSASIEG